MVKYSLFDQADENRGRENGRIRKGQSMKLKTALSLALKKAPRTSDEFAKLPKHVAIIMDGNGRWAQQHRIKVALGHQAGVEALRSIIRESSDIGINTLSLFAFSTENWRRSPAEVSALMSLLLRYFSSEIDELDEKNVRIRILGDKQGLPEPQRNAVMQAEERTRNNTGLNLCIALNYGVTTDIIRQYNGLTGDIVVAGTTIKIPLCERVTPGPTSTPTTPPPYAAPNLLLPADGTSYNVSGETITLQWAGVGSLLPNEAYEVVVEDVTEGQGRKIINYVTDTKFIVPMDFRPSSDTSPHVIRWYVTPVRQSLSTENGPSSYEPAGARSESRTFIWTGVPVS